MVNVLNKGELKDTEHQAASDGRFFISDEELPNLLIWVQNFDSETANAALNDIPEELNAEIHKAYADITRQSKIPPRVKLLVAISETLRETANKAHDRMLGSIAVR